MNVVAKIKISKAYKNEKKKKTPGELTINHCYHCGCSCGHCCYCGCCRGLVVVVVVAGRERKSTT